MDGRQPSGIRRRSLQRALEECRRALHRLQAEAGGGDGDEDEDEDEDGEDNTGADGNPSSPSAAAVDYEADKLRDLLKSRVESSEFLEKVGSIRMSYSKAMSEENASWEMVTAANLWEDQHGSRNSDQNQDDFVLVSQEDIVEGMACFMTAYLLSLDQTKDLAPDKLQQALSKMFSIKKKKSKLRKAWDGSKVIYNVASWGATAVGIYQNPVLLKAASIVILSSCRALSKFF